MKLPKNNNIEWIDEFHLNVRYGMEGQILINEISPYQKINHEHSRTKTKII